MQNKTWAKNIEIYLLVYLFEIDENVIKGKKCNFDITFFKFIYVQSYY